jgi:hypothetical protein
MPNIFPKRRTWKILSIPSVLRPSVDESVRLQERLKRCFFMHRALSSSPVQASANQESTERTSETKFGSGDKDKDDFDVSPVSAFLHSHLNTMRCQCSANITSLAVGQNDDKGSQPEEPITDMKNSPSNELSPPIDLNSDDNRTLWQLPTRARWKHTIFGNKAQAKMRHNCCPDVVEAHANGMTAAGLSSHAGPAHMHTSSQVMAGQVGAFHTQCSAPVLTICTVVFRTTMSFCSIRSLSSFPDVPPVLGPPCEEYPHPVST